MHFKIDWASLIVRRFALFYFVFEGNFPSASRGGLYLEGQFKGGFFRYHFGGLIHGAAYFWNFTVLQNNWPIKQCLLHFLIFSSIG